jgi:hypothetical protein
MWRVMGREINSLDSRVKVTANGEPCSFERFIHF